MISFQKGHLSLEPIAKKINTMHNVVALSYHGFKIAPHFNDIDLFPRSRFDQKPIMLECKGSQRKSTPFTFEVV